MARLPRRSDFSGNPKNMMVGPVNLNVPIGMEQKRKRDHAARRTPAASRSTTGDATESIGGTALRLQKAATRTRASIRRIRICRRRRRQPGCAQKAPPSRRRKTARQLITGSRRWTPAVRSRSPKTSKVIVAWPPTPLPWHLPPTKCRKATLGRAGQRAAGGKRQKPRMGATSASGGGRRPSTMNAAATTRARALPRMLRRLTRACT